MGQNEWLVDGMMHNGAHFPPLHAHEEFWCPQQGGGAAPSGETKQKRNKGHQNKGATSTAMPMGKGANTAEKGKTAVAEPRRPRDGWSWASQGPWDGWSWASQGPWDGWSW